MNMMEAQKPVRSALRTILHFLFLISHLVQSSEALYFNSTALVISTPVNDGSQSYYILDGYGIGYEILQLGTPNQTLPQLETTNGGNYGLFLIISRAIVNDTSWLNDDQWNSLYAYQEKYGVRMVHTFAIPSDDFGVSLLGSCCDENVEQFLNLDMNVAQQEFPTAGLRLTNASTIDLFHTPAGILEANKSTTTSFITFLPNTNFTNYTSGGVINKFDNGREQMAIFMDTGNWSTTSVYINHMWVHWGYRGMYQGYRRLNLQTQVDDLFLSTGLYQTSRIFRVRPADLEHHISWTAALNQKLNNTNPGSNYYSEFGFNANGNLAYDYGAAVNITAFACQEPLFTAWAEPDEGLEYQKPLGTGTNSWPLNPSFVWSAECIFLDPLVQFFSNTSNRDAFGLVSHTFTHLNLDKSTYHDTLREISYNLLFAEILNFTNALKFSGSGLIPPAITGMHNGDALRAFADNGLWNVIGDNTRPVLRANQNFHWPRITDMDINGYSGYQITPRFATRIYYNCDIIDCDLQQCFDTADCPKDQGMDGLLALERKYVPNQLMSLFHDPYMFHQPNLRQIDVDPFTINNVTEQYSLLGMWVKTVIEELVRWVDWPIISLKHDHIAQSFARRLALDACQPYVQYQISNGSITAITVKAVGGHVTGSESGNVTVTSVAETVNSCPVPVPVTLPLGVNFTIALPAVSTANATAYVDQVVIVGGAGYRREQVGNDPQTLWFNLDGQPVTLDLVQPIKL